MKDLIERQAAIRWVKTECNPYGKPTLDFESGVRVIEHLEQMPSAQPDFTHIIFAALAECGIYGEEATIKLIGTLKRLGSNDLLPPCVG